METSGTQWLTYQETTEALARYVGQRVNVTVDSEPGSLVASFSGTLSPGTPQGYAEVDEKTVYLLTNESDTEWSYYASPTMLAIERLKNFRGVDEGERIACRFGGVAVIVDLIQVPT